MGYSKLKLLLSALILTTSAAAQKSAPTYHVGSTPTADEIQAWDITISNDGKGLPAGSGTAAEGAKLYAQKCAFCHGQNGRDGLAPAVVISKDPAATARQKRVFATRVPFAPVLWDYINRAMPMRMAGTLKPDEVYSLTAYLLYENEIIHENDVLNAQSLPKVHMPNRKGYVPPAAANWNPETKESLTSKASR